MQVNFSVQEKTFCPHIFEHTLSHQHLSNIYSYSAGIIRAIVMGSYLLPDRLAAQQYCDFIETVLLGLPEDVSLAVRQSLWFQHNGASTHYGEDVWL
jgi:hypothetical protein